MQQYFLKITNSHNGGNRLQKAVLDYFERFNNVLTSDPQAVQKQLETLVTQASYTHRRCTPQRIGVNKDYKTGTISSIASGGLVTLSIYPVRKELYIDKPTPEPVAAEPVAEPKPAPEPTPAPETLPRVAIYESRESSNTVSYEYWHKLAFDVQQLLKKGAIWRIYRDHEQQTIAEQYGGFTRTAYA